MTSPEKGISPSSERRVCYYAYLNDYKDRELAERLYRGLGYNPAAVCTNCGACEQVCPSHLPISDLLHEITRAELAACYAA